MTHDTYKEEKKYILEYNRTKQTTHNIKKNTQLKT